MGVTVTPFRTQIDDCEDATDWSGGNTNDSFQLEGTFCLGEKISQTTGAENMYTFPGTNPDMTGQFIVIPMSVTGAADTISAGGYRILVEDGNTDRGTWYVGGSDTTNERWTYFTVDPSTAPTYLNGSINSAKAISTLTSSGTTATLTTSAAHGLATGDYVVIANVDEDEYNGSFSITVSSTTVFTYTITDAADDTPGFASATLHQGVDFTDVDKVGVQMKVTTKSLGNNENAFWDICWYGDGLQVNSTIDSVTIARSGTTATVTDTAHGLSVGDKVRIAGITDKTEDNGDHEILTSVANSYTYLTTNSGSTSYTGTITSSVHATWQHVADADAAGFWGICVNSQGTYILQGRIVLGSFPASGADDLLFVDDNFLCVFKENDFLPPDKNNILFCKDVTTDSIIIEMSDGFIGANNTTYGIAPVEDFTVDSIQMDGMTFSDFTAISASSDSTHNWTNIKFNAGSGVIPAAATFDNVTFSNFVADSGCLFWGSTTDNCSNFVFKSSVGLSYVFIQSHGAEETFDNFDFQDSGATYDVFLLSGLADAVAVSSLTSSGTTATLNTTAAHGLATNDWIEVAGATETEYNGFFKVTFVDTDTVTYTLPSSTTSPATGSPTWEESLIINNVNGSNASTYLGVYGEVDFVSATTVTFDEMKDNSEVRIYATGTSTELAGIEDATAGTTDDRSFAATLAPSTVVDYVIHNFQPGDEIYQTIRVNGFTWPSTSLTIAVRQIIDRNAEN